jgi:hypothetical protein
MGAACQQKRSLRTVIVHLIERCTRWTAKIVESSKYLCGPASGGMVEERKLGMGLRSAGPFARIAHGIAFGCASNRWCP